MNGGPQVISVFGDARPFVQALRRLKEAGLRELSVFSPVGLPELEHLLPRRGSPIRFVVLLGGAAGLIGGFWMCIGSALIYSIIVGGKHPESILPYCVIGFEVTVLLGGLTAIAAIIAFARLRPKPAAVTYDPRFGEDRFGIAVSCPEHQVATVAGLLREAGAEDVHEYRRDH